MAISEGVSARVAYKFYGSGVIDEATEADIATDPGAAGGQVLRRVSCSLNLSKDTYQSNEVRASRQISDFRHGIRRVQGSIAGELSPKSYGEFFEALLRGTKEASFAKTEVEFTSIVSDNALSTFTVGASTWAAEDFRVGDVVRFTDLAAAANNAKNFVIVALSGTTATVFPAPVTDAVADTAFTVTRVGTKVLAPTSGHVSRKLAVEVWNQDVDITRLFTECRLGSARIALPASGMATVDFGLMGRNMQLLTGGSSPYFAAPAAESSTNIAAAVNGALFVGGQRVGIVTGIDMTIETSPSADPVVGQDYVPDILLGRTVVTGTLTAFFSDSTFINYFTNETEVEILTMMETTNDANSPFWLAYMPRVKLGGSDIDVSGEGAQSLTLPFQALEKASAAGYDATTIVILDSEFV